MHYERFLTEVLPNLRSGRPFSYRRFDCSRMTLGEEIPVGNNGYVFVEGAYSCHPVFGDYMDRRVFLDIDGKTQEERIRKRNGEDRLQDFLQLWIPLEEAYFQTFSVWEKQITFYYRGNKRKAGHMLQQFYPDHEADSAYGIDYKTLYRKGYRGIILILIIPWYPMGHRRHRRRSNFRQTAGAGISDASIIEQ